MNRFGGYFGSVIHKILCRNCSTATAHLLYYHLTFVSTRVEFVGKGLIFFLRILCSLDKHQIPTPSHKTSPFIKSLFFLYHLWIVYYSTLYHKTDVTLRNISLQWNCLSAMAVKTEETFWENILREEWRRQTLKNTHPEWRLDLTPQRKAGSLENSQATDWGEINLHVLPKYHLALFLIQVLCR